MLIYYNIHEERDSQKRERERGKQVYGIDEQAKAALFSLHSTWLNEKNEER